MGRAALIFDDGLKSNRAALDVLREEGHLGADFAIEIEKISKLYNGIEAAPMMDADDLRYVCENGGQLCNHPLLTVGGGESGIVADAEAEHAQLRDILTGAIVWSPTTQAWESATATHFEYADYPLDHLAVLRGGYGLTEPDVVAAYGYLYDCVRTIPGTLATRGDADHLSTPNTRWMRHKCGYNIDTGGDEAALQRAIARITSIGSTDHSLILYAHDTPDASEPSDPSIPWLPLDHLRCFARAAYQAGVIIAPLRRLGPSNLCLDPRFAHADSHSFAAYGADSADWSTDYLLHSGARSARLEWTAYRGNPTATAMVVATFACRPHTRYQITYRYYLDQDLDLNGGPNNRNHGLATLLTTVKGNTEGTHITPAADDYTAHSSDPNWRRPYQNTGGQWATHTCTLTTGAGTVGALKIGGLHCAGIAHIGHISIERGDSLAFQP